MRRKTNQEEYEEWRRTRPPDPPEWARIVENERFFQPPDTVRSHEDALRLFGHILWRWIPFHDENRALKAADIVLAEYIRQHPSLLAQWLTQSTIREKLAFSQTKEDAQRRADGQILGGMPESLIVRLFQYAAPEEGVLLGQTIQASDAMALAAGISLTVHAGHQGLPLRWIGLPFGLSYKIATTLPLSAIPELRAQLTGQVPPSLLDALEGLIRITSNESFLFSELLPEDNELVALSPEEIASRLATYSGQSLEAFQRRLVRDKFLAEGEHVGAVILRDAQTLQRLQVDRKTLASTLTQLFQDKRYGSCKAEVRYSMGHHWDPFHEDDTYYLSRERGGSADVLLKRRCFKSMRISDMAPYLIRRACFFEGNVPYRADPEVLCSMLGLV